MHPPNRRLRPTLIVALAIATTGVALLAGPSLLDLARDDALQLRVIVRNPADPAGLAVTVLLPAEGRATGGATERGVSLVVVPVGVAPPAVFTGLSSDAAGAVRATLPDSVFVPDGTDVVLALKSPRTLQRVVRATASRGAVTVDLRDPRSYRDDPASLLRGVAYLPAGDIEGAGGPLHDNVINAFDLDAWIAAFRSEGDGVPADLDGSGSVGAEDLSLLLRNFNTQGDADPSGM